MAPGEKPLSVTESAHPPGLCDIAYVQGADGTVEMVTVGADERLCFRNAAAPAEVRRVAKEPNGAIPAALTCVAACFKAVAAGDAKHNVKAFLASGESRVATRFALPVREVAFSPSGATLAAGGDDEKVKLVNIEDNKVFRTLPTQPYCRGLAFDPEGEFVAVANADGTLSVWAVANGKAEATFRKAGPKVDIASAVRSRPCWHPDGSLLAAPGTDKNIVMYERLSWQLDPSTELAGEHSGDVSIVAFSSNGLYLASAAADQSVVVWDVLGKKALKKQVLAGAACGAAWHPTKNTLALITEDGEVAVWDGVIPVDLPGPNDDPDVLMGLKAAGGAEGAGASALDGPSLPAGGAGGMAGSDDYDHEDSFLVTEEQAAGPGGGGGHISGRPSRRSGRVGLGGGGFGAPAIELPEPQEPIQPGATELGEGGRRYLAFSPLGCIVLKAEEDHNTVEVVFHDTARMRRRIPLFKDFYNLSMASLGEKGALYASKSNRDSPSTVLYQPYESWAPQSDWSVGLPAGEEAQCVASGQTFAAVATSRHLLRLFSQAGLQRGVITLGGAPVALAARGHQLAAVWHAAPPTFEGEQRLAYAIYDVAEQRELASGPLPLTPGSRLVWLGFSEGEGLLAAYDSEGELRLRTPDFGGAWVPLFSAAAERKATEAFWVFGLGPRQLHCIVLGSAFEPTVPPPPQRPVVAQVALRAPVAGADTAVGPLEAEAIRHGVALAHLAAAAAEAEDAEAAQLELGAQQLEADKTGLKIVAKLIQMERHARALEAASQLHTTQALEGALRLANQLRAPALAERLSAFIEQRLAMEAAAAAAAAAQEGHYVLGEEEDVVQPQRGAVTPVPAPVFACGDGGMAGPSPSAGVKSSRASPPRPHHQAGGGLDPASGSAGPFARRAGGGGGQNAAPNNPGAGSGGAGAKRKAPAANPFARKKAVKG